MSDNPFFAIVCAGILVAAFAFGVAVGHSAEAERAAARGFLVHEGSLYSVEPRPAGWGEGGKDE